MLGVRISTCRWLPDELACAAAGSGFAALVALSGAAPPLDAARRSGAPPSRGCAPDALLAGELASGRTGAAAACGCSLVRRPAGRGVARKGAAVAAGPVVTCDPAGVGAEAAGAGAGAAAGAGGTASPLLPGGAESVAPSPLPDAVLTRRSAEADGESSASASPPVATCEVGEGPAEPVTPSTASVPPAALGVDAGAESLGGPSRRAGASLSCSRAAGPSTELVSAS